MDQFPIINTQLGNPKHKCLALASAPLPPSKQEGSTVPSKPLDFCRKSLNPRGDAWLLHKGLKTPRVVEQALDRRVRKRAHKE
ncbi:hypothetical protein DPMN_076558 [Dreissena polymorpha]|uniref:Uncharacterized protein n=1 Tax=Dreissena polymorpha TaxID=45954 RepID=A0A9D3YMK3_DREPO|nr:hypothetical protein DPMN_076558 [Dreissena polymorpha]